MQGEHQDNFEQVAYGLAEYGFAVVDHFLSEQEVNQVLQLGEFQEGLLHFKKAGIGKNIDKQINETIRGDYIKWIDKNSKSPSLQMFIGRMQELTLFLNRSLFLSLKDFEVHLTVYPAGTCYQRHFDQFRADDHRRLSVICYLNKDWKEAEGGQLRMHLTDGPRDLLPVAGRLVCFRSDQIEHEVLAASRERLSLTGWLLDQSVDLKYP